MKRKLKSQRCPVCKKIFRGPGFKSHYRNAHGEKSPDPEPFKPAEPDVVVIVMGGERYYGFTRKGEKLEQIKLQVIEL